MNHPGGWQPALPPDGPLSPTTPVRPLTGDEAPPLSVDTFDAVGMQSVLTRARDQSRFVAPVIEEETSRRPLPVKALVWSTIIVLILGVAIGVFYVSYLRPVEQPPDTIPLPAPATSGAAPAVTTQTPQEIVRDYFTALSTGQVERALAMGPRGGSGAQDLLNPNVVNHAREMLPISELEILSDDQRATEIPVRYRLGAENYETTVYLTLLDTGEYQLARTTATVEFSVPGGQNLPLVVNGLEVDPSQPYEVVPGLYELSTGLPFVDYSEASNLEVPGLAREAPYNVNVTPELTEAGETALIDAARRSLNECIAQHTMAPQGCPNRAGSQARVIDSSARWSLNNNPWTQTAPTLTAEDQSIALLRVPITTTLNFEYADGGSSTGRPVTTRVEARAPMAGADPEAITVTWSVG